MLLVEKFKPFIIPVALLVLIDQTVKIVISKVFMKCEFDIIAKVLRFNPELNTRLSYAGNFFELLSSPFVTILLNVFVLFLFLSGYMLYQAKRAHISFCASSDTRMHVAVSTVDRLVDYCLHTPADGLRSAASVAAVNALIDRNEAFLNG